MEKKDGKSKIALFLNEIWLYPVLELEFEIKSTDSAELIQMQSVLIMHGKDLFEFDLN